MLEDHRPAAPPAPLLARLQVIWSAGGLQAETWRRDVLELGLKVCAVLGAVVYVPSVCVAVQSEKWVVAVVDTVALAAVILLGRFRSLGFALRSAAFALVLYALGVALLIEVGPVCQIYLFGFAVLATLLLGVRVGSLAVGLNTVSLLVIGLAGYGAPEMSVSWRPTNPVAWVVTTLNFSLVNITLTLTIGAVLAALERGARRERAARDRLEREHAKLVAAKAALDQQMRERQALENQLVQAGKMEAVGRLAAGVAHDFNNMLTVINGYAEVVLGALPPGDPLWEPVDEIHRAGERSAGLTRQLLAFSRQQVLAPRVLDLNAVVADTASLLCRLLGEDVTLSTLPAHGLWPVKADPGQVEQLLLNLVVNARDAMPTGGALTIETRNVEPDATQPPTGAGAPRVLLAVSDTGCGMAPEVQARMFEPFFTTKAPGRGTGLGLATVYGIVEQSGGSVQVDTTVGAGTRFRVYFPRSDEPIEASGGDLRTVTRGSETLLLVEDEVGVRGLIRRLLVELGYTVLEASDGTDAVATAGRHAGPIHLLLTDVVMPGAGGREVAERVRLRHSETRVLFMSGYTDDAVVRHGVRSAEVNFLQKPFTPAALAHKIREVLDALPPEPDPAQEGTPGRSR